MQDKKDFTYETGLTVTFRVNLIDPKEVSIAIDGIPQPPGQGISGRHLTHTLHFGPGTTYQDVTKHLYDISSKLFTLKIAPDVKLDKFKDLLEFDIDLKALLAKMMNDFEGVNGRQYKVYKNITIAYNEGVS